MKKIKDINELFHTYITFLLLIVSHHALKKFSTHFYLLFILLTLVRLGAVQFTGL